MNNFSVLMPVHDAVNINHLKCAIYSVINNTIKPSQFIIVINNEIDKNKFNLIYDLASEHDYFDICHYNGSGLANVLNFGILRSNYNIIFRVDSDDLCKRNKFDIQLKYFLESGLDILGAGNIDFYGNKLFYKKIYSILTLNNFLLRNPINHNNVMFKKDVILKNGLYNNLLYKEDYYLWIKCILNGVKVGNINKYLLYSRVDDSLFTRRKNLQAIKSEFKMCLLIFRISPVIGLKFLLPIFFRVLFLISPLFLFKFIYLKYLRGK